jgi:hypothetical protein
LIRFSSYVEAEDTGPAALVTPPLVMSGKLMLRVTAGMAFTVAVSMGMVGTAEGTIVGARA